MKLIIKEAPSELNELWLVDMLSQVLEVAGVVTFSSSRKSNVPCYILVNDSRVVVLIGR